MRIPAVQLKSQGAAGRALAVAALMFVTYLTIQRAFSGLGFYYDDWSYVQQVQQPGSVQQQFPSRLLHVPLVELTFGFVGYEPARGYYIVAALLFASVLAMCWMVSALFPRRHAFAALSTALFALYPGDVSRLWMSAGMTSNRPAVLMALVSLALLFTSLRLRHSKRRVATVGLWTSVIIYGASLFLYEAQALLVPGLGFAGALWISWSGRGLTHRRPRRRALRSAAMTAAPFLLVFAGDVAWRALFLEGDVSDGYLSTASFSPRYLARQLAGAYYFNFLEEPWEVVRNAVPFTLRNDLSQTGLAALASAVFAATMFTLKRRPRKSVSEAPAKSRISPDVIFYRNILIAGMALTAVVYAVLLPHDHMISAGGLRGPFVSRLNTSAAVVVAMTAAAALMFGWSLLTSWLPRERLKIDAGASLAMGAMAMLLIAFHGIVQSDYAAAWQLQKSYTEQIVSEVPAVAPGTHFVISGAPTQYRSSYVYMFSVENMLRLVYGDETITATALNDGFNAWRLDATGLYRRDELVAPAERIVFLDLDRRACGEGAGPECGELVLSRDAGRDIILAGVLGPDAPFALANLTRVRYSGRAPSPVDDLLGIKVTSATVAGPDEGPSLQAAPDEPDTP
jgi:hypothetical protein